LTKTDGAIPQNQSSARNHNLSETNIWSTNEVQMRPGLPDYTANPNVKNIPKWPQQIRNGHEISQIFLYRGLPK
jgi:hypothetical protein